MCKPLPCKVQNKLILLGNKTKFIYQDLNKTYWWRNRWNVRVTWILKYKLFKLWKKKHNWVGNSKIVFFFFPLTFPSSQVYLIDHYWFDEVLTFSADDEFSDICFEFGLELDEVVSFVIWRIWFWLTASYYCI